MNYLFKRLNLKSRPNGAKRGAFLPVSSMGWGKGQAENGEGEEIGSTLQHPQAEERQVLQHCSAGS